MVLHVSPLCLFLLKVKRNASLTVSETSFYTLSFLEDFWGLKRQFITFFQTKMSTFIRRELFQYDETMKALKSTAFPTAF